MGPIFVSCVIEVCRLGLESLRHLSPPLCHSENADDDRTGISWGIWKDENYWVQGLGYRVDDGWTPPSWTPAGDVLTIKSCVAIDLAQLTMYSIGAMLCGFKNFTTDHTSQLAGAGIRASIFNHCNNAIVRTQEVPLVQASCDIITLPRTCRHFTQ